MHVTKQFIHKRQNKISSRRTDSFFHLCNPNGRGRNSINKTGLIWELKHNLFGVVEFALVGLVAKMYGNYVKLTVLFASLMFVTGFISLLVLSATKVFPAQKGLSFEQATCRVTRSEISCETGNCTDCVPEDGKDAATSRCLKVYVLCEDGELVNKNRSVSSEKHTGYLLRKDVYHLHDKVTIT